MLESTWSWRVHFASAGTARQQICFVTVLAGKRWHRGTRCRTFPRPSQRMHSANRGIPVPVARAGPSPEVLAPAFWKQYTRCFVQVLRFKGIILLSQPVTSGCPLFSGLLQTSATMMARACFRPARLPPGFRSHFLTLRASLGSFHLARSRVLFLIKPTRNSRVQLEYITKEALFIKCYSHRDRRLKLKFANVAACRGPQHFPT